MNTDIKIIEKYIQNHTAEAAKKIAYYHEDEILTLLANLSSESTTLLLSNMDRYQGAKILEKAGSDLSIQFLEPLNPLSTALILRILPDNLTEALLDGFSNEKSSSVRQIIQYPENTVGALADPEILTLFNDLSGKEAVKKIRQGKQKVFTSVFVLSRDQRLEGSVELGQLLVHETTSHIQSIMDTDIVKIYADTHIETLMEEHSWDGVSSPVLPVVNGENIFLGVIHKQLLSQISLKMKSGDRDTQQAVLALGNLFHVGFGSILQSLTEIFVENKSNDHGQKIY